MLTMWMKNSFMDEMNHKYTILYRWIECECTNYISFDEIIGYTN
jgi:ABC-type microcin C transport system permease subunit YejB